MKKAGPVSIRLSESTNRFVEAEAKRTRRSKRWVVEALTEEAARMRRFPGIGFRGDDAMREAWVIGSGIDVWMIIEMLQDFGSVKRLVAESELIERQVELAQAYYENYREEIDEAIAENRRPLAELRELYPFISVREVSGD